MTDDFARLLDLPAAARLAAVGDEIALLTLRHEHADKIIIERQRLGKSIDLGALLELIGGHGLVDTPQLQVTEIAAPQLPAPAEAAPPRTPTTRRTTRNQPVSQLAGLPCPTCERTFKNEHGLEVHIGLKHKEQTVPPVVADTPLRLAAAQQHAARLAAERVACPHCGITFHQRGLGPHIAKVHKVAAPTTPEPTPLPVLVAQNTATSDIPVKTATDGICDVCRLPLKLHERCSDCQALVGPEHAAGLIVARFMDQPLCATCTSFRDVARELGVAA